MQYLSSYGSLWRLSDASYRKLLRDVKAGDTWDLRHYGKLISSNIINVTDLDSESVGNYMEDFGQVSNA